MEFTIRPEQPSDYRETEQMTREAFWNQYAPGCCEHYLLHIMRECPAFLPELDLVAVRGGRIVGNVVSLKALLFGDDGNEYEVLTLGPISVLPDCQRQGIGAGLIRRTREIARRLGYRAILLCGDPDYYSRQGFLPAERLNIRTADNQYAAALQVCELWDGALSGAAGRYVEDPVYAVAEDAVAAFDKGFAPKEKISATASQRRFQQLAAMCRAAD
ncbi:N-acetyltransferase [Oscillibacter sp. MSJ-2]|uniref:N-acetyltransferase n=1 Tax=Dysosmobacter acutus TaxID=2841504 RepID=A0ABS6F7N5_9FIRM|nr:N-acetyltransferase [Dysosmobacter acutus]MBU5625612.1 N-acetyltransferase [Dysosmobacter acutus]